MQTEETAVVFTEVIEAVSHQLGELTGDGESDANRLVFVVVTGTMI
ncbi:MAG TPA: hypothetical protein VF148_11320 [Acidimicrobiia bacterium]